MYRILLLVTFLTSAVFSDYSAQEDYKIISEAEKQKLEFDNGRAQLGMVPVEVYYIYEINISNTVEGKEKMNLIMDDYSKVFPLVSNTFDFDKKVWHITAKTELTEQSLKETMAKYDYHLSTMTVQFGLKK